MAIISVGARVLGLAQPSEAIIKEIEQHPAFYRQLDEDQAENLLKDAPQMTYILWETNQSQQYALSFMDPSLVVVHRFFNRNSQNTWFYQNADPHTVPSVELLIPIIMHCKPAQCQMLKNPKKFSR